MKPPQALINPLPEGHDLNHLQDFLWAMARNVEQAMLQAGAVPGVDYTRLDLFQLAQPFALQRFAQVPSLRFDVLSPGSRRTD